MSLSSIQIIPQSFDNKPFIRTLSVYLTGVPNPGDTINGSEIVQWVWNNENNIKGIYLSGNQYVSLATETTGNLRNLSSVTFLLSSAETYDYRVEPPVIFTEGITVNYLVTSTEGPKISSTDTHLQDYDSFPRIEPPTIYVNYENTKFSNLFYRTISPNTFNFNLSVEVNPSLLDLTNYLLSSERFENYGWKNTPITNTFNVGLLGPWESLSATTGRFFAPNNTRTAQLLIPLTADWGTGQDPTPLFDKSVTLRYPLINGIKTVTSITNAENKPPGVYNCFNPFPSPALALFYGPPYTFNGGYTVQGLVCATPSSFNKKYNAGFQIRVSNSGVVTAVSALVPGSNFAIDDTIVVDNSTFNLPATAFPLTFRVETLYNIPHDKSQQLSLQPETYTYSAFVRLSGEGRYLYFRGFNQGDVIFDLQDNNTYNYGNWTNVSVIPDLEGLYASKISVFNTNQLTLTSGNGFGINLASFPNNGKRAGSIYEVVEIPNTNQILAGGNFEYYEDSNGVLMSAQNLMLLNSDGTVPVTSPWHIHNKGVTFLHSSSDYTAATIETIALSGNKIYIGGTFTHFISANHAGNTSYIPRYNIARLNLDGSLDTTFTTSICGDSAILPNVNSIRVRSINFKKAVPSVNPNDVDKILIGGLFTTVNNSLRTCFTAITGNGDLCSTTIFNTGTASPGQIGTGVNGGVESIAVDENLNRVYLGGTFNRYRNITFSQDFVALSGIGGDPLPASIFSPTTSFFNGNVWVLTIDSSSRILAGGTFTTYDGQPSWALTRILPDGKKDPTFNVTPPGTTTQVNTLNVQSIQIEPVTNKIYAGGLFVNNSVILNHWQNIPNNGHIIRLNTDGSKDTDFRNYPGTAGSQPRLERFYLNAPFVWSLALSGDNKLFAGGQFGLYRDQQISYGLTTLLSDGELYSYIIDSTEGWKRCVASFSLTEPTTDSVHLGITTSTESVSSPATPLDTILVWGAQINKGVSNTRTPYVSTLRTTNTLKFNNTTTKYFNQNTINSVITIPLLTSSIQSQLCSFKIDIPTLSAIEVTVSAADTYDSLFPWYSPHTFSNTITGIFVTRFLSASFIGFPTSFFDASGRHYRNLTFSTYTTSQGLSFYGEGHTERINLSAKNNPNITNYIWNLQDSYGIAYNTVPINFSDGTFFVDITSRSDYSLTVPITLFVQDNIASLYQVLTSGPYYRYNDVNGTIEPYPFFYSTKDFTKINEAPTNNRFRESIFVRTYSPPVTSFGTGLPDSIFLPTTDFVQSFTAHLRVSLSGFEGQAADPCFSVRNTAWSWENMGTLETSCPQTQFRWANLANGASFAKQWDNFGNPFDRLRKQPTTCVGTNIFWTLSTPNWKITQETPNNITDYSFVLQSFGTGTTPYTISIFENTPIYIRAEQIVTCTISATPFDWSTKETVVIGEGTCIAYSRGDFKIYTSNRYVPVNTAVVFQNISQGFNNVKEIQIDLDNGSVVSLTGSQVYNNFSGVYTVPGKKTITAKIYYLPEVNNEPITETFSDIIEVVTEYDTIDPVRYLQVDGELNLPYPDPPYIAPNEWVTTDNINSVFKKFHENIEYLNYRANTYMQVPTEFYGWLGTPISKKCPVWTWNDVECTAFNTTFTIGDTEYNNISWEDLQKTDSNFPEITATGRLAFCAEWQQHECTRNQTNPDCVSKYGVPWKWKFQKQGLSPELITWKKTKCGAAFAKKWKYEPFTTAQGDKVIGIICPEGQWNINLPKLDGNFSTINCYTKVNECLYQGVASKNNIIYVALKNEIRALSSDYTGTAISYNRLIDRVFAFNNIKNICIDSYGKVFVLDGDSNRVVSYNVDLTRGPAFETKNVWGSYGGAKSKYGFFKPNDIHIDGKDNIWVTDTGNKCIKQYSNTGSWSYTIIDEVFNSFAPISVGVDSQQNVHVLTENSVRVYNENKEFIFEYTFAKQTSNPPIKITTNYNREIIYVITETEVLKYFRTGVFAGYIINNIECGGNITGVFQDEYRNVLIASKNNIIKFVDLMKLNVVDSSLSKKYWALDDLFIHKNEYIQNWVYSRAFQRLWDNIEIFRGMLRYDNSQCKGKPSFVYSKNLIFVGQNELVASSTINRCIDYLWQNLATMFKYFEPTCKN